MIFAVCDDNPAELDAVTSLLSQTSAVLHTGLQLASYPSGSALLNAVRGGMFPALALLDICMPGMNGVEAARRLRELLPQIQIAFLTVTPEYAIEAFELQAMHYILKPMTPEKAQSLLDRFLNQWQRSLPVLTLRCGSETHRFPTDKIQYITSRDRGILLYLTEQRRRQWLACTFRQAAEQLAADRDFLQISRCCLVNLNAVLYMGRAECHMKNGDVLSISRRERQTVQNRYNDFLFRQMNQTIEGI